MSTPIVRTVIPEPTPSEVTITLSAEHAAELLGILGRVTHGPVVGNLFASLAESLERATEGSRESWTSYEPQGPLTAIYTRAYRETTFSSPEQVEHGIDVFLMRRES